MEEKLIIPLPVPRKANMAFQREYITLPIEKVSMLSQEQREDDVYVVVLDKKTLKKMRAADKASDYKLLK